MVSPRSRAMHMECRELCPSGHTLLGLDYLNTWMDCWKEYFRRIGFATQGPRLISLINSTCPIPSFYHSIIIPQYA